MRAPDQREDIHAAGKSYRRFATAAAAAEALESMKAGKFTEAEMGAGVEHIAVLTSTFPGSSESRHQLEPGLDAVLQSDFGATRPHTVAYAFDAKLWPADRALEWLLTRTHSGVMRFIRAVD